MAQAINTNSTLTLGDGKNKTSTGISTNIIITVNNKPVGAVKSLSIKENRSVQMINEVGTDGSIDSTPKESSKFSGSCRRIRFDGMRIAEAFGRGFVHVHSQIYPFDIIIFDKQKSNESSQIATVIKNVWITGIDYDYTSDNWVITDNMSWEAETIYSHLIGSNNPVARGGEIGLPFMNNAIERGVDTGSNGRRGSMDGSGIIDLGSNGESLF